MGSGGSVAVAEQAAWQIDGWWSGNHGTGAETMVLAVFDRACLWEGTPSEARIRSHG